MRKYSYCDSADFWRAAALYLSKYIYRSESRTCIARPLFGLLHNTVPAFLTAVLTFSTFDCAIADLSVKRPTAIIAIPNLSVEDAMQCGRRYVYALARDSRQEYFLVKMDIKDLLKGIFSRSSMISTGKDTASVFLSCDMGSVVDVGRQTDTDSDSRLPRAPLRNLRFIHFRFSQTVAWYQAAGIITPSVLPSGHIVADIPTSSMPDVLRHGISMGIDVKFSPYHSGNNSFTNPLREHLRRQPTVDGYVAIPGRLRNLLWAERGEYLGVWILRRAIQDPRNKIYTVVFKVHDHADAGKTMMDLQAAVPRDRDPIDPPFEASDRVIGYDLWRDRHRIGGSSEQDEMQTSLIWSSNNGIVFLLSTQGFGERTHLVACFRKTNACGILSGAEVLCVQGHCTDAPHSMFLVYHSDRPGAVERNTVKSGPRERCVHIVTGLEENIRDYEKCHFFLPSDLTVISAASMIDGVHVIVARVMARLGMGFELGTSYRNVELGKLLGMGNRDLQSWEMPHGSMFAKDFRNLAGRERNPRNAQHRSSSRDEPFLFDTIHISLESLSNRRNL